MKLASGYDKHKTPELREYRELTLAECKRLHGHVKWVGTDGKVRDAKVTSVKTWKTRPGDCRIGLKYGMYDFWTVEYKDGRFYGDRLVVESAEDVE